ncbi:ubiquitin carboxyl-terminal hydrolase 2 isoform X2 [Nasonia vitripennis]|uniref:Ubiquitin carboxyl-terminal hydrolase n=1 Tax=Nasonia vitripennis TaxID=7425 RepID=A0A7M7H911_NASVI|nr:ubiquitin carboxyl-terminal hydrolase 2 isoform X2 [Nasonia vitripennis]
MPFHQSGHVDAVALSYSSSAMAPLSPSISRRYSSNASSSSSSSSLSSTPKYNSYRASAASSIHDRPSYRTNDYSSKTSYNLPRLQPSSSYSDSTHRYTGTSGRGSSSSSSSGVGSNGLSSLSTSFDLSKYSPHHYVPNIQRSNASSSSLLQHSHLHSSGSVGGSSAGSLASSTSSGSLHSSAADLLGGDEASGRSHREASISSSSGSSPSSQLWSTKQRRGDEECSTSGGSSGGRSNGGRSRLQGTRDERCGLNGLRNIGNTCFMNSVIQCLSNTRPLLEYLLNEQYLTDINTTTSSMKGALIKAFSQVIQELWENDGDHVVNTSSLKSQIQRFAPRFMGYSQQDAQEFLRYLLEGLHEDVNRVTVKPQPIHTDIPDSYSDSMKAAESWKRYLRSEDSTIVDVFVGQLRSSLRCTVCDHVSVTLDPFWDLSLPIPSRSGTVRLNQCLEHFTREEVLDGDEKPTCSKCQMRRKCTKSFAIQKFPKILVIHLKRFSPMERFRGKLSVLVDFPLTGLELSAFAAPRVQGCTYNLYGVANHSGTTHSGHYTAYCKHPYSGEWHEYNDSRVTPVSARSVVSSEAYVLFYEQQPHSSHL